MDNARILNLKYETIAWGVFLIWWGIADSDIGLFASLPPGIGWVGIGLILLGLNLARKLNDIPASDLSTTLGILALVLGGLKLARLVFSLPPFDVDVFALLLVGVGVFVITSAFKKPKAIDGHSS